MINGHILKLSRSLNHGMFAIGLYSHVKRLKDNTALGVIPCRRLFANQTFTLCAMLAHNLSREIQMIASPSAARALAKRPAAWTFEKLDTLRHRIIQRAGRLIRPQGILTLSMSANQAVRNDLLHFLDVLKKAA
jgi:hypothetical protein